MPVPRFLQSVLWSYELSKMNAKRHASTIIPQILNYGTWRQVQWVLRTYHKDTIKNTSSIQLEGCGERTH